MHNSADQTRGDVESHFTSAAEEKRISETVPIVSTSVILAWFSLRFSKCTQIMAQDNLKRVEKEIPKRNAETGKFEF